MNEDKLKYNFFFYVGVVVAVGGAIFNLWWSVVFGLLLMILVRWLELDKEEKENERKKERKK
jgi:hypothetical protein